MMCVQFGDGLCDEFVLFPPPTLLVQIFFQRSVRVGRLDKKGIFIFVSKQECFSYNSTGHFKSLSPRFQELHFSPKYTVH